MPWLTVAIRHRNLIYGLGRREIMLRFRSSSLGSVWLVLQPIATVATFYFVFAIVFKNRWRASDEQSGEFILALLVGLIAFNLFGEIVNRAPGLITGNVNFVKKIVFPLEVLPLVFASTAIINAMIGCCLWLAIFVFARGELPGAAVLWVPVLAIPIVLYAIGTAWLLSALCVYFRDVGQVVPVVMQALIFMSPVFYPMDRVPGVLKNVIALNPLSIPIESVRAASLSSQFPNPAHFMVSLAVSMIVAQLGYAFFQKTRVGFADVL